jgi:hypothetical protein
VATAAGRVANITADAGIGPDRLVLTDSTERSSSGWTATASGAGPRASSR